jgi:predicted nucleotidyltransferase
MDTVSRALERLRIVATTTVGGLAAWCERFDVDLVTVFGSALSAPGEARDLDVAVRFVAGSGDIIGAWGALHDLVGPVELDLVDLGDASIVACSRALLGEPLYEARPGMYATARDAAVLHELDTAWLRRLDTELAIPS